MVSFSRNPWNPRFGSTGDPELGLERDDTLLPWPSARRYSRWNQETIQLDGIPAIVKSANGNIFWADEQCTRRVGLTSTEARLFLRLLQVDEPEDWNYADYKEMFDNFGREKDRLEQLRSELPWWKVGSRNQRKIWEARIEWLGRMREPRPWLLFLMARRKRILKQATERVLSGLRKKSEARSRVQSLVSEQPLVAVEEPLKDLLVANGAEQSSDIDAPERQRAETIEIPPDRIVPVQVGDAKPRTGSKLKSAVSFIQQSLAVGHREENKGREAPPANIPETSMPWEATREDIKRLVEKLMPAQKSYIVVGWFRRADSDPSERILQFDLPEQLFRVLRQGERDVRGWRGYLSLRSLQGFGLYKCDIARGAHIPVALNNSQNATLCQFYLAYLASHRHPDDTVAISWHGWVHKNLNNSKNNPLEGTYSLQFIYDWSSYRLAGIIAVPLLLSLVIGAWYMNGQGDVVTAWTLALYIVTAAAAVIGLLAIIGTLKDI